VPDLLKSENEGLIGTVWVVFKGSLAEQSRVAYWIESIKIFLEIAQFFAVSNFWTSLAVAASDAGRLVAPTSSQFMDRPERTAQTLKATPGSQQ